MRNNSTTCVRNDNLHSVCKKISRCVSLIKYCDRFLLDNRGKSDNPNYISIPEIRILCGLGPKVPIKRGAGGYSAHIENGMAIARDPKGQEFKMPINELRQKAANQRNMKTFSGTVGVAGNNGKVMEAETNSKIVNAVTTLAKLTVMISNIVNMIATIGGAFKKTGDNVKEAKGELNDILGKIKHVMELLKKTQNASRI